MRKLLVILMIIPLLTFTVIGQVEERSNNEGEKVQVLENGEINWTKLKIKAVGIGVPNPDLSPQGQRALVKRAAKQAAFRNLLEITQGVHVSSETTVENFMLKDDVIKSKVDGILRGYKVEDVKYMSDSTIEVVVSIIIKGELAKAMLPLYKRNREDMTMPQIGDKAKADTDYTGLIIDATDLEVLPCMAPKVYSENKKIVYDAAYVDSEYAIQNGVVGYAKDVSMAKNNERVSDNPLVVKAVKASDNKRDIYISKKDAELITNNEKLIEDVKKCKVMFIIN